MILKKKEISSKLINRNCSKINQDETISPLLWNIYYDPLFTRVNLLHYLHFTISSNKIKNIMHSDKISSINMIYHTQVFSHFSYEHSIDHS